MRNYIWAHNLLDYLDQKGDHLFWLIYFGVYMNQVTYTQQRWLPKMGVGGLDITWLIYFIINLIPSLCSKPKGLKTLGSGFFENQSFFLFFL